MDIYHVCYSKLLFKPYLLSKSRKSESQHDDRGVYVSNHYIRVPGRYIRTSGRFWNCRDLTAVSLKPHNSVPRGPIWDRNKEICY